MTLPFETYGGGRTGPMPFVLDLAAPDWNGATAYAIRDAVTHAGSLWLALAVSTGVEPGTESETLKRIDRWAR